MDPRDDPYDEMRDTRQLWHLRSFDPLSLDDGTADRVLDGLDDADVPPAYADVARSLAIATTPGHDDELASEPTVVAAFAAGIAQHLEPAARPRGRSALRRLARPELAVAAAAAGLALSGGVAAAATGSLPGAAQSVASKAMAGLGIHVPGRHSHAGIHSNTGGRSGTGAVNAPAARDQRIHGSSISRLARSTTATGVDRGAVICTAASDGRCHAGQHGADARADAGASSASSDHGGTGRADTSSGDAGKPGTGSANPAGGGASSAGSSNAASHGAVTTNNASGGASGAGVAKAGHRGP